MLKSRGSSETVWVSVLVEPWKLGMVRNWHASVAARLVLACLA